MAGIITVDGHFGELLQGVVDGRVVLTSLPCPALKVSLDFKRAAALSLSFVAEPVLSGADFTELANRSDFDPVGRHAFRLDMPAGGGAGASTATRVAVLKQHCPDLSAGEIARICLDCEGAVDPLMFDGAEKMLWASREAEIVEARASLPQGRVIGGFYGAPIRTDPQDAEFADVSDLLPLWRVADTLQDIAHISTESAQRNFALRGTGEDPIFDLAQTHGAMGVVIAHTGSARGLIFDPAAEVDAEALRDHLSAQGFQRLVDFRFGGSARTGE